MNLFIKSVVAVSILMGTQIKYVEAQKQWEIGDPLDVFKVGHTIVQATSEDEYWCKKESVVSLSILMGTQIQIKYVEAQEGWKIEDPLDVFKAGHTIVQATTADEYWCEKELEELESIKSQLEEKNKIFCSSGLSESGDLSFEAFEIATKGLYIALTHPTMKYEQILMSHVAQKWLDKIDERSLTQGQKERLVVIKAWFFGARVLS